MKIQNSAGLLPELFVALAVAAFSPAAFAIDADADGVDDSIDNCLGVANASQLDADGDGFGNACDADLNNSGTVTAADFTLMRSVLNQLASSSATAAAADLNGSGAVTAADVTILRSALNKPPGPAAVRVSIAPGHAELTTSQQQQFAATVKGAVNKTVSWKVDGIAGGNAAVGTVDATGLYQPGTGAGSHTVSATSQANGTSAASAVTAVTDLAGVFTYHNDVARTGQNRQEYALTPATVTPSGFGKRFSCALDGEAYAQPLYVANLAIGGGTHNVVFVATEHDSVYAFDADASPCVTYWQKSFLGSGVTTVPAADTGETGDLFPEIGITGTPVIDPATSTLYVMVKTKAGSLYFNRLHALALGNAAEKFGGPVIVTATVPGIGDGSSGGNITFRQLLQFSRPGLLLSNGVVYSAWGSHGDLGGYHGWVIGHDAATLARTSAFNSTPSGYMGSFWMSGAGPAADAAGNIYLISANGHFNEFYPLPAAAPDNDFGDSILKLSPTGGLHVTDFFAPYDQDTLDANDIDLGSGGAVVLPDGVGSVSHPHLLVGTGKTGLLYLLDRDNMGRFTSGGPDAVLQEVVVGLGGCITCGVDDTPAVWQTAAGTANVYVVPINGQLQSFAAANGTIGTSPASTSTETYDFPGATPAVSSAGFTNGVVWVLDTSLNPTPNPGLGTGPAVLRAYDGTNVHTLLYDSSVRPADAAAIAVKFTVPTIANGRVYVGGVSQLTVYGLLP